MTVRIALVTEIPAPYRLPAFDALAAREDVELLALFLAESDPRRQYRFDPAAPRFAWHVLKGLSIHRGGTWLMVSRGVGRALRRFRPDVVIVGGWNQPAFWHAARYARRTQVPLVVWIESTSRDARSGRTLLHRLKRRIVRGAAALVPGQSAADYAASLGVPRDRIEIAPNTADLRLFAERIGELRRDRAALRSERGLDGFVVLSVGRLEHEKGTDLVVRAMNEVDGTLVLVGTGSLEPRLRELARDRVRFAGHVPPDELPEWYAVADVFVLPSRSETWGIVLNEAAAAGLPIVASEVAGGARELVESGTNGFIVVPEPKAIAAALRAFAEDESLRASAGPRSFELAEDFTPEAWAEHVAALTHRVAG